MINSSSPRISRVEFILLIALPFVLWLFCFRDFFYGSLPLLADAISYFEHIGFYTEHLSRGVYPLWDPFWFDGAPYHFFLRRIGDVNPFFLVIILLKWCGFSVQVAYLVFLAMYYFLSMMAFYLIARLLFKERLYAFLAYVMLMFSSWGSQVFYNYIILIFLPIIWFFYFLLSFAKQPRKVSMLGMCFCLGLIVTTYIPFYFLIIGLIVVACSLGIYFAEVKSFLKQSLSFIRFHKVFAGFCLFFVLVGCLPAMIFYQESKAGEFILPHRHSGSKAVSAVAVGLDNIASGDIISHGFFDKVFADHAFMRMGDVFIPHLLFLLVLCSLCGRLNKLLVFLFLNIFILSSIAATNIAPVHKFLFEHVVFFKYIRNIYYLFWVAILPMAILFVVGGLRSLLKTADDSGSRNAWWWYILACHALYALFLSFQEGVLWGAWMVVLLSFLFFCHYFWVRAGTHRWIGFLLIACAVIIQSLEVYEHLTNNISALNNNQVNYSSPNYKDYVYKKRNVTAPQIPKNISKEDFIEDLKFDLYYGASWFAVLSRHISPNVFNFYNNYKFIFYDNVEPYQDQLEFLKVLESDMATGRNIAYVPYSASSSSDWRSNDSAPANSSPIDGACDKLRVTRFEANSLEIKTRLDHPQFLVINDNYNSGWRAFINGQKVRLLRANVAFKGLWIPAGESTIELRYLNPWHYGARFMLIVLFWGVFAFLIVLILKDLRRESNP